MCKIGSPLLSFLLCSLCTPLQTILWTCDSNTHLEQDCDLTVYIHSSEPNHLRISTTSRIATLYLIDLIYFTYVNNKNLKLENYTDI